MSTPSVILLYKIADQRHNREQHISFLSRFNTRSAWHHLLWQTWQFSIPLRTSLFWVAVFTFPWHVYFKAHTIYHVCSSYQYFILMITRLIIMLLTQRYEIDRSNRHLISFMADTCTDILSYNMKPSSPECYTIFWSITICSNTHFPKQVIYQLVILLKGPCISVQVSWLCCLVPLRNHVTLAIFQSYRDVEAGDNQSLKSKWRDRELNPGPLAPPAKSLTTTTYYRYIDQIFKITFIKSIIMNSRLRSQLKATHLFCIRVYFYLLTFMVNRTNHCMVNVTISTLA